MLSSQYCLVIIVIHRRVIHRCS